jgi:hypothetical protein
MDKFALLRSATLREERQRPLPDAELDAGEFSSLSLPLRRSYITGPVVRKGP